MTHQRGMVPKSYFELINKSGHQSARSNEIDQSDPNLGKRQSPQEILQIQQQTIQNIQQQQFHKAAASRQNRTLYAITLYDFRAEREDELDIWFIAKPINRLGGPGLVPASYVSIVDKYNPSAPVEAAAGNDMEAVITRFKIPTVEEWKESTAIYQASTRPTGTNASSSAPSQFSHNENSSTRSSSASSRTVIVEATVDSYHLAAYNDTSRYQYIIIARTSTGNTRQLYRFYEDFFNLQVRLLEKFPEEAGKVEDLIALPPHISRCDEVLALFEVQNNGLDREFVSKGDRSSKPINQQSGYQQERLSQYSNMQLQQRNRSSTTPSSDSYSNNRGSSPGINTTLGSQNESTGGGKQPKVKVKFYFEDDIFVLLLPVQLKLSDLKLKLAKRLGLESPDEPDSSQSVSLFLKEEYEEFMDAHHIVSESLSDEQWTLLYEKEISDDTRFHGVLHDKCKIVILPAPSY
ncbi:hypothetical protein CJJ09_004956 [Candidozyma auris]|nr:hypothetical protein CJJ09_004956 [[Candida] auris]